LIFEFWIFVTAVIFTFVGMSFRTNKAKIIADAVEHTVDKLVKDQYIKTRIDENGEIHLLKYYED
jgi:hypothetical protein